MNWISIGEKPHDIVLFEKEYVYPGKEYLKELVDRAALKEQDDEAEYKAKTLCLCRELGLDPERAVVHVEKDEWDTWRSVYIHLGMFGQPETRKSQLIDRCVNCRDRKEGGCRCGHWNPGQHYEMSPTRREVEARLAEFQQRPRRCANCRDTVSGGCRCGLHKQHASNPCVTGKTLVATDEGLIHIEECCQSVICKGTS
jgi:hypothetical protein